MLDLGSGPGTAIAAAARIFLTIASVKAVEGDRAIAMIPDPVLASAAIDRSIQDLKAARFEMAELVTLSYVLGELQPAQREAIVDKAWAATQQLLLVIEPGTPEGHQRILAVRSQLLAKGGHIVAPCPHEERCPMQGTKDWCHFAARVERSSLHRQLKSGELGHEDEKFAYVAFAKQPVKRPPARIVRHPWQGSGFLKLELCVDGKAIRTETVTRSAKDQHRLARKARWGDAWPPILNDDER